MFFDKRWIMKNKNTHMHTQCIQHTQSTAQSHTKYTILNFQEYSHKRTLLEFIQKKNTHIFYRLPITTVNQWRLVYFVCDISRITCLKLEMIKNDTDTKNVLLAQLSLYINSVIRSLYIAKRNTKQFFFAMWNKTYLFRFESK